MRAPLKRTIAPPHTANNFTDVSLLHPLSFRLHPFPSPRSPADPRSAAVSDSCNRRETTCPSFLPSMKTASTFCVSEIFFDGSPLTMITIGDLAFLDAAIFFVFAPCLRDVDARGLKSPVAASGRLPRASAIQREPRNPARRGSDPSPSESCRPPWRNDARNPAASCKPATHSFAFFRRHVFVLGEKSFGVFENVRRQIFKLRISQQRQLALFHLGGMSSTAAETRSPRSCSSARFYRSSTLMILSNIAGSICACTSAVSTLPSMRPMSRSFFFFGSWIDV